MFPSSSSSSSKSKSCSFGLLISLFLLLPSCGPSTSPLLIQLRTADTRTPIAHASVEADSLALGTSLQFGDVIDDLMGRRAAFSSRAMTDEFGTAHLEYVADRAIRVTVLGAGSHAPFMLLTNDLQAGPTGWLKMLETPTIEGRFELRASTPAHLTSPPPPSASR